VAPGVTLNLSKSGGSLSFGVRGAHFTMGPRGNRVTAGVPGTGLFYTRRLRASPAASRGPSPSTPTVPMAQRLSMGFLKRLVTPKDEENLVDGLREYVLGRHDRALQFLGQASNLADAAYLAAILAVEAKDLASASRYLATADQSHRDLGRYIGRYGIDLTVSIGITPELTAHAGPSLRGVLLMRVEVHQARSETQEAMECLERLRTLDPGDVVVTLSLIELLLDTQGKDPAVLKRIVRMTRDVENITPVHAALLLYKARALVRLGLHTAARDTLTTALRRRKDRPDDLLHAVRYERALVYEAMGSARRARGELERLYAEAPDYEDVAERLGMDTQKEKRK
jgi:tetratricopeptide (TPR) repeat protein